MTSDTQGQVLLALAGKAHRMAGKGSPSAHEARAQMKSSVEETEPVLGYILAAAKQGTGLHWVQITPVSYRTKEMESKGENSQHTAATRFMLACTTHRILLRAVAWVAVEGHWVAEICRQLEAAMMQFLRGCQTRNPLTVWAGALLCRYCSDPVSHCLQAKGSHWLLGLAETQGQQEPTLVAQEGKQSALLVVRCPSKSAVGVN